MFAAFLEAALDLDVLYLGVAISYLSIEINPYGVPYYQMGPHGVNNPTNDDMIYIYFSQVLLCIQPDCLGNPKNSLFG